MFTFPVDDVLPVTVGGFFVEVQSRRARVLVGYTVGAVDELVTCL